MMTRKEEDNLLLILLLITQQAPHLSALLVVYPCKIPSA